METIPRRPRTATEISVLGPLRVHIDGAPGTVPGRKLRTLLAVLAVRGAAEIHRDMLIDELGLADSTGNAPNALHAHIARLRRWLDERGAPPDTIEFTGRGYRIDLPDSAVDARRFTRMVERALGMAPAAPALVAHILDEALSLWQGDALADIDDGPVGRAAADDLRRLRATARELLLEAWLALDRTQQVTVHGRRFIEDDPLNERMHAQMITALQRLGRHAEAVAAFGFVEAVLRDELGVQPGHLLRTSLHRPATLGA